MGSGYKKAVERNLIILFKLFSVFVAKKKIITGEK